ncbi:hypothetical protein BH09BAC1_BH09BAC1_09600 [soil metagenome]
MVTSPPKPVAYKVFWYVLGLSIAVMGVLSLLAWIKLDAIEDIDYRIAQFYGFSNKLFYANFISYLILLSIAAYIHRKHSRRRYYLLACGTFLLFSYIGYGLLNRKLIAVIQSYDLPESTLAFNTYFGILLSVAGLLMTLVVFIGISMRKRKLPIS